MKKLIYKTICPFCQTICKADFTDLVGECYLYPPMAKEERLISSCLHLRQWSRVKGIAKASFHTESYQIEIAELE